MESFVCNDAIANVSSPRLPSRPHPPTVDVLARERLEVAMVVAINLYLETPNSQVPDPKSQISRRSANSS
jgi:hypothetical protein